MGIERTERIVCDWCGKEITDRANMVTVRVMARAGHEIANVYVVFCSKEEANEWWQSWEENKDKPLFQ